MILKEFALLASDSARSKAYLQAMIQANKLPAVCIVYSDDCGSMKAKAKEYRECAVQDKYFDIDKPVIYSLEQADIPYILVENKDINSEQMKEAIQGVEAKYLIYSGYGGYILKPHLFQLNKKYVHVHAGILPQYRGSTTVFYSYLQENVIGATAIFLNEKIDEGEMIVQDTFQLPSEKVDIDYIYEPYVRSRVLLKAIDQYLEKGILSSRQQEQEGAETYFIIHPLLKHIALLGIESAQKQEV